VGSSLFAVYDGHGGSEVAVYLSQHLPDFLKGTKSYKNGSWKEALSEAYLKIDESIRTPDVLKEIVRLSKFGKSCEDVDSHEDEYMTENVDQLFEEATMPIEKLVAKYKARSFLEEYITAKLQKQKDNEREWAGSSSKVLKQGGTGEAPGQSCGGLSTHTKLYEALQREVEEEDVGKKHYEAYKMERKVEEENVGKQRTTTEVSVERISELSWEDRSQKTQEAFAPTVIKNGVSPAELDSATNSTPSSDEDYAAKVNGQEDSKDEIAKVDSSTKVVGNGLLGTENGGTQQEKGSGDGVDLESSVAPHDREESILVVPKKKGKVHQPPVLQLPPKTEEPSPTKRTSPRKNTEKVYMDFLQGESTSEESEDEDDPTNFGVPEDSDSEQSSTGLLAEVADFLASSPSDEGEEDDDDEDEDASVEEEDEQEDDEMLKDYQEPGYDSGATAVTAFTRWEGNKLHLWVANAGDSR